MDADVPSAPSQPTAEASAIETFWQDLKPTVDLLLPPKDDTTARPPISYRAFMTAYTAVYNFITSSDLNAPELYKRIDLHYLHVAQEILRQIPHDDSTLAHCLIRHFKYFSVGVDYASRMFRLVERIYVKPNMSNKATKLEDLKDWGYVEGGSQEEQARAEAYAQAASSPERIIPLTPLAHRRFRTEVIDQLLMPKIAEGQKEKADRGGGCDVDCRLFRAVQALLRDEERDVESRRREAAELASLLKMTGMKVTHPLWMMLNNCGELI